MSAKRIKSSRRNAEPTGKRERDNFRVSTSASEITIASSKLCLASNTTIAVIILVMLAIGMAFPAFLEYSARPVKASYTTAACDNKLGKPSLPKSGTAGTRTMRDTFLSFVGDFCVAGLGVGFLVTAANASTGASANAPRNNATTDIATARTMDFNCKLYFVI